MTFVDLLTSATPGGLFGGLLGLANTWVSSRIRREERAHELELLKAQQSSAEAVAAWSAFKASQDAAANDNSGPAPCWVSAVRSLTRPALTLGLLCSSVAVYATLTGEVRADVGRDLLGLTGLALGWWFGSRPALLSSRR